MVVAHQPDETRLRERLAEDPWHDRVLTIERIEKWSLWLPPRRPGGGGAT